MSIAPPPKVNPSAVVLKGRDAAMLGARAIVVAQLAAAGVRVVEEGEEPSPRPELPAPVDPIEARRRPVPPGYKKVFHGHKPHQGAKEMARRRRQMERK
jgi:hypothetical protein